MTTTAITQQQPKASALTVMSSRFSVEPNKLLATLKSTVFKGASDEELLALVVVANEYGLNPLTREIYAFPAKGGGITPVVSIDGWANMANSHPQFDGLEFEWDHDPESDKLIACTCIIYRKDRSRPIKVTEYLTECKRNTEPWKMEHRMLRHKALSQCVRIAFGFGGVFDEDEAREVPARVIETAAVVEAPKPTAQAAPAKSKPSWERSRLAQPPAPAASPEPAPETVAQDDQGPGLFDDPQGAEGGSGDGEYQPSPHDELKLQLEDAGIALSTVEAVLQKAKRSPKFNLVNGVHKPLKSVHDLSQANFDLITKHWPDFLALVEEVKSESK